MADQRTRTGEAGEEFDADTLATLDDYLIRLQHGESVDRDALVAKHPELAEAIDCLEGLERLAPEAADGEDQLASGDGKSSPSVSSGLLPGVIPLPEGATVEIGDYELLRELGRGGMGVVYLARQKSLDRLVALKMILAGRSTLPEAQRRFRAEARSAAALDHPHIVKIHDAGQWEGQPYYAMQYVQGESLAGRLRTGALPIDEGARLISQLARAVDVLHQHRIVHRDLKPSNVLLDSDGQPILTDFGLAKHFVDPDETLTGFIAGTPSYMPPEQAAGRSAEVTPAADVYSLGSILYELLTGRPPFREENPLDTLARVLDGEPPPPRRLNPHLPPVLENICLRCLEKSPDDRYPSAAALADDLERYLQGEPVEVEGPGLVERAWRWLRREPALAMRLIALVGFFLVQQFNYHVFASSDSAFNLRVSVLLAVWVFAALSAQRLLRREGWTIVAGYVWGTVDGLLFCMVLWLANSVASPLIIGYPLLIVAAGLWFRVRFVWYMTGLAVLSYLLLAIDYHVNRVDLQQDFDIGLDHHVIYVTGYVLLGAVVAYQAYRLRVLRQYQRTRTSG